MGLKIALATPWMVKCGIYTYSKALAEAIAKLGHEVYIVRLIRFGRKTSDYFRVLAQSFPEDTDVFVISHEYGLYQNHEPTFYRELKSIYPKKKIVTILHAIGKWDTDNMIAYASDKVVVHNEFCFRRFGHPDKTVLIRHGCLPVQCPPKNECRAAWDIHPTAPVVGYGGFISPYKGLEVLIQAMNKVKAALVIGGGWHVEGETMYMERLREQSLKLLPGRCRWLGYVPDEKLATFYGSLDCFVYPSRYTTESGALLTALSHGKAVIASDLAPMREKAKLGALMTFKSVKDLRRKIKRLLKDEELRRKLEDGAKRYAQETSWSKIAEQHVRLYKDVIEKGKGG